MKSIKRIAFTSIFLVLIITVFSSASPVPDTGVTQCYDNEGEIACPQPGEDFYGQDGSYLINPHSYTKLDANRNDLPDSATSWVTVRDNVTGLIWEVKTDDGRWKHQGQRQQAFDPRPPFDPSESQPAGHRQGKGQQY